MGPDAINSIWRSSEVWKFEGQVDSFLAGVLMHALSVELDFNCLPTVFRICLQLAQIAKLFRVNSQWGKLSFGDFIRVQAERPFLDNINPPGTILE